MRIEVDMIIGERRSNPKDSDDRRVTQNSSGQPPKVDTKGIIPNLVEEAVPDHTVVPDHTEMGADLEANQEIEALALALAPEIEKSRQRDQRVIW